MAKLAVIQTGGKQYIVKPGDSLKIEKIKAVKDGDVIFDKVLLTVDGEKVNIGRPFIEGARVEAKVEKEGRTKKITVIRYKSKTRYHKKKGHRQPYTQVLISKF
ncbi:MAG: 50S ribosomal protein L21 [Candidatus Terrybacteria bacterium]|nr:50S ribosomal protein L21 [Candidatus Terrybacteria bacterium]